MAIEPQSVAARVLNNLMMHYPIAQTFLPVSLTTFDKINGMIKKGHITHETDGLIFAKDHEPYSAGTCETLLKWKPPNKNSFDFKVHVEHGRNVVIARLYVGGDGDEEIEFRGTGVSTMECSTANKVYVNAVMLVWIAVGIGCSFLE